MHVLQSFDDSHGYNEEPDGERRDFQEVIESLGG